MNIPALATNGRTPACHENQNLFSAAALDYDPRDEANQHLDLLGHTILAARKAAAEEAAVDVCFGCPLMLACEQMDTEYSANPRNPFIAGIIGGRTESERRARISGSVGTQKTTATVSAPNPQIAPGDRGPRNQVDDELVATMTRAGKTSDQIAEFIGCSPRTVSRARARMGLNATKHTDDTSTTSPLTSTTAETIRRTQNAVLHAAHTSRNTTKATECASNRPFAGGRISGAMEAVYNHLVEVGGTDHIDRLLAVGMPHVDAAEALDWWTKHNSVTIDGEKVLRSAKADTPMENRIREGARSKVFNAISATHRKGRYLDRDGDTYTFKPAALAAWIERINEAARVAA